MGWQWAGLSLGLVGVALVVGGDARVQAEPAVPLWAYTMPFVGMAGLVVATLVERKASLDTPLDVALAIQCAVSALLFTVLALFWGGLEPAGGVFLASWGT